jgi:hypothetical protein
MSGNAHLRRKRHNGDPELCRLGLTVVRFLPGVTGRTPLLGQTTRKALPRAATVAAMTYLIVGLDRQTLTPWHQNVQAEDASAAARAAVDRARRAGVDLVVAAAIGPGASVISVSLERPATPARAA